MESCLQFNQEVNKPSHTFLNTLLGSQSELLISDSVICERLQLKSSNRKGENIKSNLKFWALLLNEKQGKWLPKDKWWAKWSFSPWLGVMWKKGGVMASQLLCGGRCSSIIFLLDFTQDQLGWWHRKISAAKLQTSKTFRSRLDWKVKEKEWKKYFSMNRNLKRRHIYRQRGSAG